jgi:transcriptional regulator with XRE-family HTH domain
MNKSDMKKSVGEAISKKRQEKQLTQHDLSVLTGLSRNYISDIENGRYLPSVNALSKIASSIKLDLNFLVDITETKGAVN